MDADAAKYRKVVEKLNDALDGLEESLEPLLAKPMSETLTGMTGALDQAKLNVLVPYMVHDLIFIYLKTIGVDPKTHPVVAELERIKQYFAKIKQAEDPEKRRLAIDREAAGRFIKHAIAQAKAAEQRDATAAQKQEEGMDVDGAEQAESSTGTGAKRRRPAFDPFAGYGDTPNDAPSDAKRTKVESSPFKYAESAPPPKKGKGKGKEKEPAPAPVEVPSSSDSDSDDSVLDIIEGDPSALVVEDPNPNNDGSWTLVQKAKERKEKLGFGDRDKNKKGKNGKGKASEGRGTGTGTGKRTR